MTEAQQRAFDRAHRRVAGLQPDVAAAVLTFFRLVTIGLSEVALAAAIRDGSINVVLDVLISAAMLERASVPLRRALRSTMEKAFTFNTPSLPKGGKVDGTIAIFFDRLNPRVLDAIRTLETRVITELHDSVRETVRQAIERGITEGLGPRATARYVREVISLGPRGETAVANYRAMLEAGDREALTRQLRDRRFDPTLDRALGQGGAGLSAEQVDRMVAAYSKKTLASNAETIARTATLESYKIAQRESWASAIDAGIVDQGRLNRRWIGVGDDRERPGHLAMNNTVVGFDEPYPNGDTYAGQGDPWNCRCIDLFFVGS